MRLLSSSRDDNSLALRRAAAPCIRQTLQPLTAGARQRCPLRFDLAVQRGASWALSIEFLLTLSVAPSLWLAPPPCSTSSGFPWASLCCSSARRHPCR